MLNSSRQHRSLVVEHTFSPGGNGELLSKKRLTLRRSLPLYQLFTTVSVFLNVGFENGWAPSYRLYFIGGERPAVFIHATVDRSLTSRPRVSDAERNTPDCCLAQASEGPPQHNLPIPSLGGLSIAEGCGGNGRAVHYSKKRTQHNTTQRKHV